VKNKSVGIQTFVVPIRDTKTLKLLPGVEAGDIGPKMGFFKVDNGFLLLTGVKLPREYMLMR